MVSSVSILFFGSGSPKFLAYDVVVKRLVRDNTAMLDENGVKEALEGLRREVGSDVSSLVSSLSISSMRVSSPKVPSWLTIEKSQVGIETEYLWRGRERGGRKGGGGKRRWEGRWWGGREEWTMEGGVDDGGRRGEE